ncbi:MAG: choloylglycine hydrolase family protein [Chlamydiae bacterium]|nr:choloylglycine hydrolase family protein [Chlamydiota bacterium]
MSKFLQMIVALIIGVFSFDQAYGCTGIKLIAKDGSIIHGRTSEFGSFVETSLAVIPRGYAFVGTTHIGPGLSYVSKYAVVGSYSFNDILIIDGMNEKGLAVGTFYFPGFAEYSEVSIENQTKALSPIDFPNWLLTQFATIEEVKEAITNVVIAPTLNKNWGGIAPPFHYIVYDKSGASLVIEPINGKLIYFENKLGVLTNSPSFDWHMTNLRNFINLRPENVKPIDLRGVILAPFGQGSGMVGMPGDFTPSSRFVKAAIFSTTAIPSANAEDAVFQTFHILNQFDIPKGLIRDIANGVMHTEYTIATCVRDPQSLKYYFKTYDNQNIKVVDLNKFDLDAKSIKTIATTGFEKAEDISSKLK